MNTRHREPALFWRGDLPLAMSEIASAVKLLRNDVNQGYVQTSVDEYKK